MMKAAFTAWALAAALVPAMALAQQSDVPPADPAGKMKTDGLMGPRMSTNLTVAKVSEPLPPPACQSAAPAPASSAPTPAGGGAPSAAPAAAVCPAPAAAAALAPAPAPQATTGYVTKSRSNIKNN